MTDKPVPLTHKTARELVKKHLALSLRKLYKDLGTVGGAKVYTVRLGTIEIVVENDWYTHNGLLSITIRLPNGHSVCSYYDPKTLETVEKVEDNTNA